MNDKEKMDKVAEVYDWFVDNTVDRALEEDVLDRCVLETGTDRITALKMLAEFHAQLVLRVKLERVIHRFAEPVPEMKAYILALFRDR